jgi:hypothetical protein
MLDAAPLDPEVDSAVKRHQRERFAAATKAGGAPPPASASATTAPSLELTARVERKYMAAQVVESGVLGVAPPVEYGSSADGGGAAAVKRYTAQLQRVASAAGFSGDPVDSVSSKLDSAAAGAETAREVLVRIAPYCSAEFHSALQEALAEVEAGSGGRAVPMDGASPLYKKWADKVKATAQAHKLPWQMLMAHHKAGGGDEAQRDSLARDYGAWLQTAALVDARAELDALSAEACRALDAHLRKSPEDSKREREASAAALLRRAEAAKGQQWADRLREDLAYLDWFDAKVASNPVEGPKAATNA